MEIFSLHVPALKAHLQVAAAKDVRFYLNAVYFVPERGHLVSTDGSALLLSQHPELRRSGCEPIIIPRSELAAAIKAAPKKAVTLEMSVDSSTGRAVLTFRPHAGAMLSCEAVDARYPDYARVIPGEVSGEPGNYDAALLGRVAEAVATLAGAEVTQHVRVYQNGADGAAWVRADASHYPDAPRHVAVIMPVRIRGGETPENATDTVASLVRGRP